MWFDDVLRRLAYFGGNTQREPNHMTAGRLFSRTGKVPPAYKSKDPSPPDLGAAN